ncbi:MAG: hypothetical protein PHT87_02540 [Bacteroidales bacterium]|nr:hypothetical protein [Bacteroidales bacterium]MDD4640100.1 hypothetical protein [Bacteroidales bacterium]
MKNFRRIFLIIGLGAFLWTSCTEDIPVREESPAANPESMQVYFPNSQKNNYELPPTVFEVNIDLKREKYAEAATVRIIETSDLADAFTVPETVSFAAGDSVTTLTITFDSLEQFKSYQVSFKVEDDYINPYVVNAKGTSDFNLYIQHNDYMPVGDGNGQLYDAFTLYSVADVKISYSEKKDVYRITNPYSEALLLEAEWEGWLGGPITENIEIQITAEEKVTWDFWYIGLTYQGGGIPIKAYFPSYLDDSFADLNDLSGVIDENLLELHPYFYVDGLGGFGTDYPVYISMPGGPDLNELLGF